VFPGFGPDLACWKRGYQGPVTEGGHAGSVRTQGRSLKEGMLEACVPRVSSNH
jgi:hypothetical protein